MRIPLSTITPTAQWLAADKAHHAALEAQRASAVAQGKSFVPAPTAAFDQIVSQIPSSFAAALEAHRAALEAHRMGKAGVPAPVAHPLLDSLVARVPRGDPHPDDFVILPYEIVDDTPRTAEQNQALSVLRETLAG
jgi:hypothetical protein